MLELSGMPVLGSVPSCGEKQGSPAKGWYGLSQHSMGRPTGGVSVPGGPGGSEANIPSPVLLWPPSDLGVKLQSSPMAMITLISFLCAAASHQR